MTSVTNPPHSTPINTSRGKPAISVLLEVVVVSLDDDDDDDDGAGDDERSSSPLFISFSTSLLLVSLFCCVFTVVFVDPVGDVVEEVLLSSPSPLPPSEAQ
jgi:hypothetical protein